MINKVIDGQNISLSDAIGLGFKRLDDQQFELVDGDKRFILSNLVGVVKQVPVVVEEVPQTANKKQEIKHQKQVHHKPGHNDNDDEVQLAPEPLEKKDLNKENENQTKALEQNGFHVIGEDGYQTSGKNNKKSTNNKYKF